MKNFGTAVATAAVLSFSLGHRAVAWTTPSTAAAVARGQTSGSLPRYRHQSRFVHKRSNLSARDRCLRASTRASASYSDSRSGSGAQSTALSVAGDLSPSGQRRPLRRQLPAGRRQSRLHATTSTAAGVESDDDGIEIAGACAPCIASLLQQRQYSTGV